MKSKQHLPGQWFTLDISVNGTTRPYGIWAQSLEQAKAQAAQLAVQETVKEVMWQGIEEYQVRTEERRIPAMESMVIHLKQGRVILYGKNMFEGPIVEYRGPLGSWRCPMTSTFKLKGEPKQEGAY